MLVSCGGSGSEDDTPTPQPINNAPNKPANIEPLNNVLCINNVLTFQWSASSDQDNDVVKYELQVAKDNQLHGFCIHYNEDGKKSKEGEYKMGQPIGIWKEYNKIGVTQKNYGQ